jgi:molybdate transport system ATP-binding protein
VRGELRELLRALALPTLLVTHDFDDAAVLADRIGVVIEGRLAQLDTPQRLVAAPADAFVASLTGANLLPGVAFRLGDLTAVRLGDGQVVYSSAGAEGPVGVVVHPWEITVSSQLPGDSSLNHVRGRVTSLATVGNRVRIGIGGITAEITRESADRLGVVEGAGLIASFKATATRLVALT